MVELERIRCTKCGGEFSDEYDPQALVLQCRRIGCGAMFIVRQGQEFAKTHGYRDLDIQNLRKLLDDAVEENVEGLMNLRAQQIRALVPEDAFAAYIESLGQKKRGEFKPYADHLEHAKDMTQEEASRILNVALNPVHFTDHDLAAIQIFIQNNMDEKNRPVYQSQLDTTMYRLFEAQNRYAVVPRDVFICHSSADLISLEVYQCLTDDGDKCWISEMNMPPKTIDYWEKIEEAIQCCKIILVICSGSAMLRDDPMREMRLAEEYNLERLEFKVDKVPHTVFFKHYFDGLQWVMLEEDREQSFSNLKERVYALLNPKEAEKPQTEGEKPTELPGKEETVKKEPAVENDLGNGTKAAAEEAERLLKEKEKERQAAELAENQRIARKEAEEQRAKEARTKKAAQELERKKQIEEFVKKNGQRYEDSYFWYRIGRLLLKVLFAGWITCFLLYYLDVFRQLDYAYTQLPFLQDIVLFLKSFHADNGRLLVIFERGNPMGFFILGGALILLGLSIIFGLRTLLWTSRKLTFWLPVMAVMNLVWFYAEGLWRIDPYDQFILQDKVLAYFFYMIQPIAAVILVIIVSKLGYRLFRSVSEHRKVRLAEIVRTRWGTVVQS